jgi:transposase
MATATQTSPDWIRAHAEMLEYFGVCPEILVPDNCPCAVTKAEFYEPSINLTYNEISKHYELVVLPARRRKPKDKARVEGAVLIVEREVLAPLRNRTFFDLCSLNEAISEGLETLNNRPFKKLPGCRREVFERHERPVMKALPARHYDNSGRVATVDLQGDLPSASAAARQK